MNQENVIDFNVLPETESSNAANDSKEMSPLEAAQLRLESTTNKRALFSDASSRYRQSSALLGHWPHDPCLATSGFEGRRFKLRDEAGKLLATFDYDESPRLVLRWNEDPGAPNPTDARSQRRRYRR